MSIQPVVEIARLHDVLVTTGGFEDEQAAVGVLQHVGEVEIGIARDEEIAIADLERGPVTVPAIRPVEAAIGPQEGARPVPLRRRIANCAGIAIRLVCHYLGAHEYHRFPQCATHDGSVP
jgi:hypothetical protein